EDGIRDFHVTGVQTCALPISCSVEASTEQAPELDAETELAALRDKLAQTEKALAEADLRAQAEIQNMRRRLERDVANAHKFALRSEERRVGTASRFRGCASPD